MDETQENNGAQSSLAEQSTLQHKGELIPQAHGGSLAPAGTKGNKGGGRPKESYRRRMRKLLGMSLAALERELQALLNQMSGEDVPLLLAGQTPHGPLKGAPITRDELIKIITVLGRYGLGSEDSKQVETKDVRYVIRVPARIATRPASGPIAVIESPVLRTGELPATARPVDQE